MSLLVALLACRLLGVTPTGIDDAYIFFEYAEHVAAGQGLVYNTGGERVEGFSSPAWLAILSLLFTAGLRTPELVLALTAFFTALGLQQLLFATRYAWARTGRLADVPTSVWVFLGSWLLASPGWFLWNIPTLMDLALWGAMLSVLFAQLLMRFSNAEGSTRGIGWLLALLVWTRPEAMAWVVFVWAALFLFARWRAVPAWPVLRWPVLAAVASVVLLLIVRVSYFGYPLPNTYYAKVSSDLLANLVAGSDYLREFFLGNVFAALALAVGALVALRSLPVLWALCTARAVSLGEGSAVRVLLAWMLLYGCLVPVLMGGDHFGGWRFLQPVYPWIAVGVCFWFRDWQWPELRVGWLAPGVVLLTVLFTAPLRATWFNIDRTGLINEFEVASEGQAVARTLQAIVPRDSEGLPEVGVTGAGGFAYAWSGSVFDLLGLNDTAMAHADDDRSGRQGHAAFNADVFLARRPEIILPHIEGWRGVLERCADLRGPDSFYWRALEGLQDDTRFRADYSLVVTEVESGRLCFYARNDYLQTLTRSGLPWMLL